MVLLPWIKLGEYGSRKEGGGTETLTLELQLAGIVCSYNRRIRTRIVDASSAKTNAYSAIAVAEISPQPIPYANDRL